MPYDLDQPLEEDYLQLVQSDLIDSVQPESAEGDLGPGAGPTVVTLDDKPGPDNGEDTPAPVAPAVDMGEAAGSPAPAPMKRGRPSRSASGTPAATASKAALSMVSRPAMAATTARTSGRKRKAADVESVAEPEGEEEAEDEAEPEPEVASVKPGRPVRATGAAARARLAAKAAKKRTRGHPKGDSTAAAQKPARAGRPKKNGSDTNGATPTNEYEVEAIVDSMIDADTMEHKYFVKWKGYPASENTWEPKTNLVHAAQLVAAFDAKKKKKAVEDDKAPASREKKKPGRKPKAKA